MLQNKPKNKLVWIRMSHFVNILKFLNRKSHICTHAHRVINLQIYFDDKPVLEVFPI